MITEKNLCTKHQSFWSQLFPSAQKFVRHANLAAERFAKPYSPSRITSAPEVVNEAAVRLASKPFISRHTWSREQAHEAALEARSFVSRFRATWSDYEIDEHSGYDDVIDLAKRVLSGCRTAGAHRPVLFYSLPGAGIVEACEADAVSEGMLVEIKAGERNFRSPDFRQLAVYCALQSAAKRPLFKSLALINPRTGLIWSEHADAAAIALSGLSMADCSQEILDYISHSASETQ